MAALVGQRSLCSNGTFLDRENKIGIYDFRSRSARSTLRELAAVFEFELSPSSTDVAESEREECTSFNAKMESDRLAS